MKHSGFTLWAMLACQAVWPLVTAEAQPAPAPVGKPEFSPAPKAIGDIQSVTLSSSTPGAWFRYTLDGATPARTRGYVYCGVISVRPGMTVKAIAYKSGMADSAVAEATWPAGT